MSVSDRESASFRGLALSGGGLRASFFHIGVLARMAELDLLRGIERISTVSGGSIVGALYYLKVKECLEESHRGGKFAEAADYVRIVQDLCEEFLAGAQQDVRSRTFAHWRSNWKAEASQVIGGLYDDFFYRRYRQEGPRLRMRDLRIDREIVAAAETSVARAPNLFINATLLDTGQRWVFTPEDMGLLDEDPVPLDEDPAPSKLSQILGKRHKYEDLKGNEDLKGYEDLPLGLAVAASACVPMVFPPVWLHLWPFNPKLLDGMVSEIAAREAANQDKAQQDARKKARENMGFELVDGGVVDNLGLAPLRGAKGRVLVSNASAPSRCTLSEHRRSGLAVGGTSLTILMSRTQQAASLQALAQLRDRRDLVEVSLARAGNDPGAWKETDEVRLEQLLKLIQNVRTDLDAFSAWESHALMYAGYVSAGYRLEDLPVVANGRWPFQGLKAELTLERAQKHLSASSSHFKIERLRPYWMGLSTIVVVLCLFLTLKLFSILRQTEPSDGLFATGVIAIWMVLGLCTLAAIIPSVFYRLLRSCVIVIISRVSLAFRPLVLRSRVPWHLDEQGPSTSNDYPPRVTRHE
jgi:predicted acylesterase/phospholipase RssA